MSSPTSGSRPATSMTEFVRAIRSWHSVAFTACAGQADRQACTSREFVESAALAIGGYTYSERFGFPGPAGVGDPLVPSLGTTGWRQVLLDNDNNPARHFIGWVSAGYNAPDAEAAVASLMIAESAGRPGASQQDVNAGLLAIELGVGLRTGNLRGLRPGLATIETFIIANVADPTNVTEPAVPRVAISTGENFGCGLPVLPC